MCSSRWSAFWPQAIAITFIGLGAASCSDSERFSDFFGPDPYARNQVTGSIQQQRAPAPTGHIDSQALPPVVSVETQGASGGGRGMGSYQPANASGSAGSGSYQQASAGGGYQSGYTNPYPQGGAGSYRPGHMGAYQSGAYQPASYEPANTEITGATRPAAPPPLEWTWEGGTPITVLPGETVESLARRHNVPVAAIVQANNLSGQAVHPGQHLVIPRYRTPTLAYAPPTARIGTAPPVTSAPPPPVIPKRAELPPNAAMHVVEPGETLHSIARLYGKSDWELVKANNIRPNERMHAGERIIIPDAREKEAREKERLRVEAPPPRVTQDIANAESSRSAWRTTPVEQPPAQKTPKVAEQTPAKEIAPPTKAAESLGSQPSFRWPARGPVLAGFGPQPNGTQNDGIDLEMANGTPVKAADDGIVTYAGDELQSYGKLVLIRHGTGYVTAYAHANDILVKKGDLIKRGQIIARSGATGAVKEPELHFEIRKGTTPVDPSQFLGKVEAQETGR
jgi:murein DD-endopeptidase MepM/ murein hydrolase activator NlpD